MIAPIRLEKGHNPLVFETGYDDGAQVLVSLWVEEDELRGGRLNVTDVEVALRPYRGATWGPPLRRTGGG